MRSPAGGPPARSTTAVRAAVLGGIVLAGAVLAVLLHRTGHTQGDDFALYLRQARSLFDGDVGDVVADNRFSVLNSDRGFSPIAYPWGWPLLLAPFVQVWGFDYDQLKLVVVAAFCVWLVLLHGIVRRRLGRGVALAFVAVFATAPLYLDHTDELLSEFASLAAVALVIWWYDRLRRGATLLTASRLDLVVLGLLVMAAFNVRRESVALLAAIGAVQLFDLGRVTGPERAHRTLVAAARSNWRALVTPALTFVVSAIAFQLALPSQLLRGVRSVGRVRSAGDLDEGRTFLDDRLPEFPGTLTEQLGLGNHPAVGVAIIGLAAIGVVIGLRRRPELDLPLVVLAGLTAFAVGTSGRQVDRYWLAVTPWALYFVTVAVVALVEKVIGHRPRVATAAMVAPLCALVVAHLVVLPGDVGDAREYDADGNVQFGPAHPDVAPVFDAVQELTPPDAVIAYFRSRTMTLLTDRRSFQTKDLDHIAANADFFVQRRDSGYWQPDVSPLEARQVGFESVWSNDRFVVWDTGRSSAGAPGSPDP